MSEAKYRYNKKNLSYEKIEYGFVDNLRKFLSYLFVGTIFAAVILFITYTFYNSPKEKILKREVEQFVLQIGRASCRERV